MFQSFTFFVSFQQLCFSFAFRQLLQPGSIDGVATKVFVVAITVTLCRDIDSSAKEDERKAYFSGETGHPSRNHRCELLLVNVSSDRVYSSAKHREKITTNDESCSSSVSSCTVCVCVLLFFDSFFPGHPSRLANGVERRREGARVSSRQQMFRVIVCVRFSFLYSEKAAEEQGKSTTRAENRNK